MKRLVIVFLFISSATFSQNFSGKAIYKTHRKIEYNQDSIRSYNINEDLAKSLAAQLRRQFQRVYTLNFTKNESTWRQEEKISKPLPKNNSGVVFNFDFLGDGTDVFYKNLKENRYVKKTEIGGKRFLIKNKLRDYGWELTSDTKNIGKYTCYKATFSEEEVTSNSMTKSSEEQEDKIKKEKVTITTTAWFTLEIPISNGPENYTGLPGLILEINKGDLTIVCSEIILNPKEKTEIIEPNKGKIVTQQEFDKITEEFNNDFLERYKRSR